MSLRTLGETARAPKVHLSNCKYLRTRHESAFYTRIELTHDIHSYRMILIHYERICIMPKTITLRLSDEDYQKFLSFARSDNRPLANAIETLALRQLEDYYFADSFEMDEIMADKDLLKRLKAGSEQAKKMKGRFVD